MLDWLIRHGTIIDGSGRPGFEGDIGIQEGYITAVGNLADENAGQSSDAHGLIVAPGFIDIHSHDDGAVFAQTPYTAKLTQGVTTVVVGNCGFSPAPSPHANRLEFLCEFFELQGWEGGNFTDYLNTVDRCHPLLNVAALVGHGTIRASVVGFDDRPVTTEERSAMKACVREAMDAGAFGLSTGLIYPPACFSDTDEIVELAQIVGQAGGIYASHIRDEGDAVFTAVAEAISIGERARLPVEISHVKLTGRRNWGGSKHYLEMIEDARARGVDVTGDMYPYNAGCTGLNALLPPWAHDGGPKELLGRLRATEPRELLRRDLTEGVAGWWNPYLAVTPEDILLTRCPDVPEWEGKTLSAIAAGRSTDPIDTIFDILDATHGRAIIVVFAFSDKDIRTFMRHPFIMFGTDGTPTGPLPHPRTYGTFAHILGHYVRDEQVLDLPEAIRKMTCLPAQRLGLADRGMIQPGYAADLVAFDPETILDKATYLAPAHPPAGIHSVWVNGTLILCEGRLGEERAGQVLRRRSSAAGRENRRTRVH